MQQENSRLLHIYRMYHELYTNATLYCNNLYRTVTCCCFILSLDRRNEILVEIHISCYTNGYRRI